jgi:sugar (pentulose or hexulose) kinase
MSIKAIGVTGMVPTLIPLDAEFHPIDFSIQQQDNRAAAEIETMQRDFDADWVFEKTGNMINSQHSGPKLIWMKKHKPDLFSRMSYILGSYDYIRYILCGTPAIERNWALESGMWDIREQRWLDEVLSYCAINTSYFRMSLDPRILSDIQQASLPQRPDSPPVLRLSEAVPIISLQPSQQGLVPMGIWCSSLEGQETSSSVSTNW